MTDCLSVASFSIPVVYEDPDIIALDKPVNLASIPERNPEKTSLLKLLEQDRRQKFWVVHRLDKQVSGIILFAKNASCHRSLNRQFEQRQVKKTYLALVHGDLGPHGGVIDMPLRRFASGRMGADPLKGKTCVTEFKVRHRRPDYSLAEIHPLTGRKHQIRAHFFIHGNPLVGDPLYGDKARQKTYKRLMLHALSIEIKLPGGRTVAIESRLPADFIEIKYDLLPIDEWIDP